MSEETFLFFMKLLTGILVGATLGERIDRSLATLSTIAAAKGD